MLLRKALARDQTFALAYVALASTHSAMAIDGYESPTDAWPEVTRNVRRALDEDQELPDAHSEAAVALFFSQWDWAGAEAEFRRALDLNPGSRAVLQDYGWFLTAMGRLDEGLALSRKAAELDPLSVGPAHDIAINYMITGDLDQAAASFRHAIDIDPNWTWGYIKLSRTLARQKKCPEALAQAEIAERRIAGGAATLTRSWLGTTYGMCGETMRARQKLDELHALEKTQYVDPVTFADVHSSLGEADEALRWYEKAYEDRTPNMAYASVMPRIDPALAGNARFGAIVRRMGFPGSRMPP